MNDFTNSPIAKWLARWTAIWLLIFLLGAISSTSPLLRELGNAVIGAGMKVLIPTAFVWMLAGAGARYTGSQ